MDTSEINSFITKMVTNMVSEEALREDAVQDVWVTILRRRALEGYDPSKVVPDRTHPNMGFQKFLHVVVRNAVRDWLRLAGPVEERLVPQEVEEDTLWAEAFEGYEPVVNDTLALMFKVSCDQFTKDLLHATKITSPKTRKMQGFIVRKMITGTTQKEIANELGVSPQWVNKVVQRMRCGHWPVERSKKAA
jgi:RNA polymerase sigma factor (sigma-70 family)